MTVLFALIGLAGGGLLLAAGLMAMPNLLRGMAGVAKAPAPDNSWMVGVGIALLLLGAIGSGGFSGTTGASGGDPDCGGDGGGGGDGGD